MSEEVDSIYRVAAQLPTKARAELAHRLIADLDAEGSECTPEEIEAEWLAVAERRAGELRAGATKPVPGEEVLARIRARQGA